MDWLLERLEVLLTFGKLWLGFLGNWKGVYDNGYLWEPSCVLIENVICSLNGVVINGLCRKLDVVMEIGL